VACGKLDVHHMICAWCRNVRYCDSTCQLRHWQHAVDPHKPHCGRRREAAAAERSSSDPSANTDGCEMTDELETAVEAAEAAVEATQALVVAALAPAEAARRHGGRRARPQRRRRQRSRRR